MSGLPNEISQGTAAIEEGGLITVLWGDRGEMSFQIGHDYSHEEQTLMFEAACSLGHASPDDDDDTELLGKKAAYVRVGKEYRLKKLWRIFEDIKALLNGEARDILRDGKILVVREKEGAQPIATRKTRKPGTAMQKVRPICR